MDTYDPDIDNPYPTSEWNEITKVEYISPLILRREAAAIQTTRRVRVDADYIVGEKYEMAYRLDEERRTVTVPKGMLTDLSSSPRFAALAASAGWGAIWKPRSSMISSISPGSI